MTIVEHSMGLKFAAILRKGKVYAVERQHVMRSDQVLVWTSTMLSAQSWRGALISDMSGVNRQWSPSYHF